MPTNRRKFLKLLAPLAAYPVLRHLGLADASVPPAQVTDRPNILIVVFDTLSAGHMPVYGYARDTTPHMTRFAQRATVFERHFAGGNFTTPGTASLLTGTYPWSHRAFNIYARASDSFTGQNLFSAFGPSGYHRLAYTHNRLADYFLNQFSADIDHYLVPETFYLSAYPDFDKLFPQDRELAYRSSFFLTRPGSKDGQPGSLFLGAAGRLLIQHYEHGLTMGNLDEQFPEGLPNEASTKEAFLLEHGIDGMKALLSQAPRPFLGYFHFLPPHSPYNPRREFVDLYQDQWTPPAKAPHFFGDGRSEEYMNQRRRQYDSFLAYADAEFGRLYDYLKQTGLVDNTYVVVTSDHGEMFERGIFGHATPLLYNPIVRIPLLISRPGQRQQERVTAPTSCTDILPTLLAATGQAVPAWCEGQPLPLGEAARPASDRSVFSVEAKRNPRLAPLARATVMLAKGPYKLVHYLGYDGHDGVSELYDLANDPEEMNDLAAAQPGVAAELRAELLQKLQTVNAPFARSA
jgi:arylsulfatase A-like enzyme